MNDAVCAFTGLTRAVKTALTIDVTLTLNEPWLDEMRVSMARDHRKRCYMQRNTHSHAPLRDLKYANPLSVSPTPRSGKAVLNLHSLIVSLHATLKAGLVRW